MTVATGSGNAGRTEAADLTDVVAAVRDSVVTITSEGFSSRGFQQIPSTGVGSGIVLTGDGYILTNRHVVEDSQSLTVELADGRQFDATIVDISDDHDLALIKIDATGLSPAVIGNSDALEVGPDGHRDRQPAWHVHRDGHPRASSPAPDGRSPSRMRRPVGR